jgi:hypothetical protein
VHASINRVAAVLYFGVMLAVLANRAVYSALKRVPALFDKEERLRRDPRLAKGDQAASAKHKTCHLSAPSLGSGARVHRGVRSRAGGTGGLNCFERANCSFYVSWHLSSRIQIRQ